MVGNGAGERLVRGEARVPPIVLVPAAAEDPGPGGHLASPGGHPPDHLVVRARPHQVHVAQRGPEPEEVGVRVHHPRDHRVPVEVHHPRGGSAEDHRAALRAHEEHPAAPDRHRLRHGPRVVHGVDPGVGHDQVGGALLRPRRGGERGRGEREERNRADHGGPGSVREGAPPQAAGPRGAGGRRKLSPAGEGDQDPGVATEGERTGGIHMRPVSRGGAAPGYRERPGKAHRSSVDD